MTKTILIGQRNDELEKGGLKLLFKFQVAAFKMKIIEVCNSQLKAGPFKRRQTFRKEFAQDLRCAATFLSRAHISFPKSLQNNI